MKKITLSIIMVFITCIGFSQSKTSSVKDKKTTTETSQGHRIVFQMTSGDTLAHLSLMKQLVNVLTVSPSTKIVVVCHGPGLEMLVTEKSIVGDKIKSQIAKGVVFDACEFAMKTRNVDKSEILPSVLVVPSGIIEIVTKVEEGWVYIKSGF